MVASSSFLALPPCPKVGWRSVIGPGPSTPLDVVRSDYLSVMAAVPDSWNGFCSTAAHHHAAIRRTPAARTRVAWPAIGFDASNVTLPPNSSLVRGIRDNASLLPLQKSARGGDAQVSRVGPQRMPSHHRTFPGIIVSGYQPGGGCWGG